jgi:MFS family permease
VYLLLFAFLRQRSILIIGLVVMLGAPIPALLEPVLPLYQRNQLGATPTIIGLLFLVLTISGAFSVPLAGGVSDRLGRVPLMLLGLLLTALTLPLVALTPSLLLEGGALVLLGLTQGLVIAPTMPALADEVDRFGGGAYGAVYSETL